MLDNSGIHEENLGESNYAKKINALLFNFTKDNLDAHEATKENMTSGRNVLKDIIQFENGEFSDSPFVQLIEIACDGPYNHVNDEQMSNKNILIINNLK